MMAEDSDDVFDEVETEEKTEVETEKGEEEKSKEEPKEESPSSEDVSKSEAGQTATIVAERLRRQDAEAERDDLKKQLEGQKTKAKPEVVPDAAVDPEGHNRYLDNKFFAQKLEMSEEMLGDSQGDYDKLKIAFTNLVSEVVDGVATVKDQALYKNFRQARNPAKFLIDHMGDRSRLTEVSASDYESKQEEKYRKKFIAEAKEKGLTAMELPDLTTEAAAGSNTVTTEYDGTDDMWDEQPAG